MLTAKYCLDSSKDQILGCHNSVSEHAGLLDECVVGWVVLDFLKVLWSFRTLRTRHLVTPHHIPEDLNSQCRDHRKCCFLML